MKNQIALKKLMVSLAVAGMAAGAAQAATTTGNASANVLTPLSVAETTAMSFGSVSVDSANLTTNFTLAASNGATTVAPAGAVASGASQPGAFSVTGAAGASYTFAVDATVTLNPDVGNPSTDTLSVATSTSAATGTIDGTAVYVGGTLTVPNTASGSYSGTYAVTVAYQ